LEIGLSLYSLTYKIASKPVETVSAPTSPVADKKPKLLEAVMVQWIVLYINNLQEERAKRASRRLDTSSLRGSSRRSLRRNQTEETLETKETKEVEAPADTSTKELEQQTPDFRKFKAAFDSLMEESDFSKNKKEEVSKYSTDKKWQLLKEYKSSTLNMLV
jgi:hypothetical protein